MRIYICIDICIDIRIDNRADIGDNITIISADICPKTRKKKSA